MFDDTAADYDRVESLLAWGRGRWYRREALLRSGLKSGMAVCDVGCGTGLVTREALASSASAARCSASTRARA
ncbi:MAG: class I SAM-dependent methyltransferase [Rubrivivax sp.]